MFYIFGDISLSLCTSLLALKKDAVPLIYSSEINILYSAA